MLALSCFVMFVVLHQKTPLNASSLFLGLPFPQLTSWHNAREYLLLVAKMPPPLKGAVRKVLLSMSNKAHEQMYRAPLQHCFTTVQ